MVPSTWPACGGAEARCTPYRRRATWSLGARARRLHTKTFAKAAPSKADYDALLPDAMQVVSSFFLNH